MPAPKRGTKKRGDTYDLSPEEAKKRLGEALRLWLEATATMDVSKDEVAQQIGRAHV